VEFRLLTVFTACTVKIIRREVAVMKVKNKEIILAGVTVYMPTYILNQSEIVMMFESGAGVEVVENEGFMTTRVYLPWSFMVCTQ
jgi:hypothetical protein